MMSWSGSSLYNMYCCIMYQRVYTRFLCEEYGSLYLLLFGPEGHVYRSSKREPETSLSFTLK